MTVPQIGLLFNRGVSALCTGSTFLTESNFTYWSFWFADAQNIKNFLIYRHCVLSRARKRKISNKGDTNIQSTRGTLKATCLYRELCVHSYTKLNAIVMFMARGVCGSVLRMWLQDKKIGQGSNVAQIPEIVLRSPAKQIQADLQAQCKSVSNQTICCQLGERGLHNKKVLRFTFF